MPHGFVGKLHTRLTLGAYIRFSRTIECMESEMRAKTLKTASVVIGAIGLALVVMMIVSEGELGALPLGLVLIGVVGYVAGHTRERSANLHRD